MWVCMHRNDRIFDIDPLFKGHLRSKGAIFCFCEERENICARRCAFQFKCKRDFLGVRRRKSWFFYPFLACLRRSLATEVCIIEELQFLRNCSTYHPWSPSSDVLFLGKGFVSYQQEWWLRFQVDMANCAVRELWRAQVRIAGKRNRLRSFPIHCKPRKSFTPPIPSPQAYNLHLDRL